MGIRKGWGQSPDSALFAQHARNLALNPQHHINVRVVAKTGHPQLRGKFAISLEYLKLSKEVRKEERKTRVNRDWGSFREHGGWKRDWWRAVAGTSAEA